MQRQVINTKEKSQNDKKKKTFLKVQGMISSIKQNKVKLVAKYNSKPIKKIENKEPREISTNFETKLK